jgi:hypothetical protein
VAHIVGQYALARPIRSELIAQMAIPHSIAFSGIAVTPSQLP